MKVFAKHRANLEDQLKNFPKKAPNCRRKKKFFRDDAGRLKSECERAAGDVSDLNRRLDAANEGLKTANEELSRLKDSATVSQADFDDAKRLKGLAEAEVARLQGELQAAQDDAAAKELARTQAATKATELETALNDAHAKIADILGKTANPSDFENDLDELINQGNEIISKSKEVQTLLAKDGEDPSTFDPMTRLGEIKETVGALVDETNPTNGTLVDNLNAVSAKVDAYRDVVDGWTTLKTHWLPLTLQTTLL
ncbi:MAG: hypothetical protein H6925_04775 [Holosporaceae bacterium]|nr:MAG: hypothetical protein H6925_04775 [Holosporaceae bacterium]